MKCRYCHKDARPNQITCGADWCEHYRFVARRELREVAKSYPELAKRAGIELPEKKTEEESLKELGF